MPFALRSLLSKVISLIGFWLAAGAGFLPSPLHADSASSDAQTVDNFDWHHDPPYSSLVDALLPPPPRPKMTIQCTVGLFNPSSSTVQTIYANAFKRIDLTLGYRLSRELTIVNRAGFSTGAGKAVGKQSGEVTGVATDLRTIPLHVGLAWNLERLTGPTLIPYLEAGVSYLFYREEVDAVSSQGGKWGSHVRVGLAIRIDGEPAISWPSDAATGLRNAALTLEGGAESFRSFTRNGLDLSGGIVMVGFKFEY